MNSERIGSFMMKAGMNTDRMQSMASKRGTAVCMLPGTELAFEENVRFDSRWVWPKTLNFRVGKFGMIDPHIPDRHHDAVEFPDGTCILVTQLREGQRVTVLQLPVREVQHDVRKKGAEQPAPRPVAIG